MRTITHVAVLFAVFAWAALPAPAGTLRTWTGLGGDGDWLTATNWSGDEVPDTVDEDALIDGNSGADVTVLLKLADGTNPASMDIGALTLDANDTLNLRIGSPSASGTLTVASLVNSGLVDLNYAASGNIGTGYLTVSGADQLTNNAGATISARMTSGSNRRNSILSVNAQNTNDGDILVLCTRYDRNTARMRLYESGTFTNNGTITIRYTSTNSSSSYSILRLMTDSASVTLGGTGSLVMEQTELTTTHEVSIRGSSSGGEALLTNGASHTIAGEGLIYSYLNFINDGFVHATADEALEINPTSYVTNGATGRMVASGAAGLVLGGSGDTFTNNGLLEARTGSAAAIGATTLTLGGEIRGGGAITGSLPVDGILAPGDLRERRRHGPLDHWHALGHRRRDDERRQQPANPTRRPRLGRQAGGHRQPGPEQPVRHADRQRGPPPEPTSSRRTAAR